MRINSTKDRNHIYLEKLAHLDGHLVYLLAELSCWGKNKGDRPLSSHQLRLLEHVRQQRYQVRISLSRACLTVGKYGTIVAFEALISDWTSTFLEELGLFCFLSCYVIKCESHRLFLRTHIYLNFLISLNREA